MRFSIGKRIAAGFVLASVLVLLVGAASLRTSSAVTRSTRVQDFLFRFKTKTVELSAMVERLRHEEHTVAAGSDDRLKPLVDEIWRGYSELTGLTGLNSRLLTAIWRLQPLLEDRLKFADRTAENPAAAGSDLQSAETRLDEAFAELKLAVDAELNRQIAETAQVVGWSNKIVLTCLFGSLGVMFGAGMLITRSIVRPLYRLINGIEQVRDGDLSHRIPVESSDETGRLTQEFNRMLEQREKFDARQQELLSRLEHSNSELKEFAYVVSHDLKAPLRSIGSLASWIQSDYTEKLDEDGKETLDLLAQRVQRMHDLIDGILQYSRVGRAQEKMVETDLNELVRDAIELVAPPPNIQVTVAKRLPAIFCEPTRILQLFQNLISNAVKYMDKPEGWVKISSEDAGLNWRFRVADNGPGIDPKYHEKIFQIFQTLRQSEDFDSTGVGLSVVKKIVKLYGGKIWVESDLGQGAVFLFELPKRTFQVTDVV